MYSKVYNISCAPGQADALMSHYDQNVTPAIQASEYHVGHLMIETGERPFTNDQLLHPIAVVHAIEASLAGGGTEVEVTT